MKRSIAGGLVGVVMISLAGFATADVKKGLRALEDENYKVALREFRKSADKGDPEAMYNLGWMYNLAQGVPRDHDIYADWIQRSAEAGFAQAENSLGWIYTYSREKPETGFKWFLRAAEQGNADGILNVAYGYEKGLGTTADGAKAIEYYQRTLDSGNLYGGYAIGVIHYNGKIVPKDFAKAAEYFEQGAAEEHALSEFFLAHLYYKGEGVEADYEAYEDYRRRAARHGHLRAQLELGRHHGGFFSSDQDYAQGADWYELAAEQGSVQGMVGLLEAYRFAEREGAETPKTKKSYLYWLEQAALKKDGSSAWEYAGLLDTGDGVEQDQARALEMADIAVEANYPQAMRNVGKFKMQTAKNEDEFLEGFKLVYGAAAQEEAGAMLMISDFFLQGQVVNKNLVAAYMWVLRAEHDSYGESRDQLEGFKAALEYEMSGNDMVKAKSAYNNCHDFYHCVLEVSNFTPKVAEAVKDYRPEYFKN